VGEQSFLAVETEELMLATGERLRIPCEAAALRVVLSVLREARV